MKRKRASGLEPISALTASVDGGLVVGDLRPCSSVRLAGVHGRLFELGGVHFAQALEAADLDLGVGGELALDQLVLVLVVARIDRLGAVASACRAAASPG